MIVREALDLAGMSEVIVHYVSAKIHDLANAVWGQKLPMRAPKRALWLPYRDFVRDRLTEQNGRSCLSGLFTFLLLQSLTRKKNEKP